MSSEQIVPEPAAIDFVDAWHFRLADGTTQYLQTPENVGDLYSATPPIVCCANGLHGSVRAIDALEYGSKDVAMICRTRHSGETVRQSDKLASEHRVVLWQADCTAVLHEFGCLCAEDSFEWLRGYGPVPEKFVACVAAKRAWLHGEISGADLEAAWGAQNLRLEAMLMTLAPAEAVTP